MVQPLCEHSGCFQLGRKSAWGQVPERQVQQVLVVIACPSVEPLPGIGHGQELRACPRMAWRRLNDRRLPGSPLFLARYDGASSPWTVATQGDDARLGGAYSSDTTDREWALVAPLLPAAKPGGRSRRTCQRRVVDAIFYLLQTGSQWRMLPRDFPPRSTIYGNFRAWRDDGTWARIHDALYRRCREPEGRQESPSAANIDSQSIKNGPDAGESVGFDAGKRVKGRKRHLLCDTLGLMMRVEVHSVGV